jgi:hypothetical protein
VCYAGYFQPEEGQFGCINCDILGNDQEHEAQTSCIFCAANTQRYVGVLSAMNRSSCQCKEGANSSEGHLVIWWRPQPLRRVQASMHETRKRERCVPFVGALGTWPAIEALLQACEKCTARRAHLALRRP